MFVLIGSAAGTAAASAHSVAQVPRITVHSIPLSSDWSHSAGFGSRRPGWYVDQSGVIHLQGAAKQVSQAGSTPNLLGLLPKAARPFSNIFVIVHTFAGTFADLEVARNGDIDLIDPRPPAVKDYSFVSLEGVTFRRSGKVQPIAVDTAHWTGLNSFGARALAWYTDRSGIVHLQGAASQFDFGPGSDVIGTLPKAARPSRDVFAIMHTFLGTYADVGIAPNGTISLIAPRPPLVQAYSFASLEGITFKRSGKVNPIALNASHWSPHAGFGSRSPGWYTDGSGVVHLQGAAKQVKATGSTKNLLGTLPKGARPSRNVFVIAHTFAGTYVDLGIATNGTITLIDPRPPAVKDYSFVSLEGITYKP